MHMQWPAWHEVQRMPLAVLLTSTPTSRHNQSLGIRAGNLRCSGECVCPARAHRRQVAALCLSKHFTSALRRCTPRAIPLAAVTSRGGAKHQENYLRNRRARGGEFVGPPDALLTHGTDAAPGPPWSLQQQLQRCLLETAPGANVTLQRAENGSIDAVVSDAVAAAGVHALSRLAQPGLFRDHVPAGAADAIVPLFKRNGGLTLDPPDVSPGTLSLKPAWGGSTSLLPHHHRQTPHSVLYMCHTAWWQRCYLSAHLPTKDRTTPSHPAHAAVPRVPLPTLPPPAGTLGDTLQRDVHVFWDVGSAHPGGLDPRAVATHIRGVLGCYGRLAGLYVYALPKQLSWVPEAFMLMYAPQRLPGEQHLHPLRKRNALQMNAHALQMTAHGFAQCTQLLGAYLP